jgi:hypothetical protein
MSENFDEEFDLLQALRESQALEMVEETENGWQTKVVPCALSQAAAKEIVQLRQQVNELRNQLNKKTVD